MPSKLNKLRKNAQPKKTGNIFVLERLKGDWRVEQLKSRCIANCMDNLLAIFACVRQNHTLSNYSDRSEQRWALQGANYA